MQPSNRLGFECRRFIKVIKQAMYHFCFRPNRRHKEGSLDLTTQSCSSFLPQGIKSFSNISIRRQRSVQGYILRAEPLML